VETGTQIIFKLLDSGTVIPSNNEIVNLLKYTKMNVAFPNGEEWIIWVQVLKAKNLQDSGKFGKLASRGLFKSIERLFQLTYFPRSWNLEPRRQPHENILLKVSMKKDIVDVHLMHFLVAHSGNC